MFSLGHREKAVPNIDIWHAHLKSSLEEPSHPTLHKFISINILWPIAEILHVSFSAPQQTAKEIAAQLRVPFQRQGWTSRLRQQTRLLRHIFEGVDGSTLM